MKTIRSLVILFALAALDIGHAGDFQSEPKRLEVNGRIQLAQLQLREPSPPSPTDAILAQWITSMTPGEPEWPAAQAQRMIRDKRTPAPFTATPRMSEPQVRELLMPMAR